VWPLSCRFPSHPVSTKRLRYSFAVLSQMVTRGRRKRAEEVLAAPRDPLGELHPIVWSWDLWIGLAAGAGAGVAGAISTSVRANGFALSVALAAVDVAILGVALVVMQLFVALLDPDYALAIDEVGGVRQATRPYLIVSFVAGAGAVVAIAAAVIWGLLPAPGCGAMLAASTWLTVWTIVGTVQLVGLSLFHSDMRSKLALAEARARAARSRQGRSA
jgi:hypothetical protein